MRPYLLIDKSTFKSLSPSEVEPLKNTYSVVVPTELIMEILASSQESERDKTLSVKEIIQLSKKLLDCDPTFSMRYEDLGALSLLGFDIPMTREAFTDTSLIQTLMISDALLVGIRNREMLKNWANGDFTKRDEIGASSYRNVKNPVRLFENFKKEFKEPFRELRTLKNYGQVVLTANHYFFKDDQVFQQSLFSMAMKRMGRHVPKSRHYEIEKRWKARNSPLFFDFAPYAGHIYLIELIYILGISSNVIPTNRTFIDMMYFFYLPFCHVFSSGDDFHKNLCPLLLRDDQKFIQGELLKGELKSLALS